MTKSTTRQAADVAHVVGRKNLIINGGFDVWQRGTSQVGSGRNSVDRWIGANGGAMAKDTDANGNPILKFTTNGNPDPFLCTIIEDGVRILRGKTITFSCYIKSTHPDPIQYLYLRQYGTGATLTSKATISSSEVGWDRYVLTAVIPDSWTANDHLFTNIEFTGGMTTDIWVKNVQLELGSVATDFEHRSYGEELALCQRYYQRINTETVYAHVGTYNHLIHWHKFPVHMRTIPTTVDLGSSYGSGNKYVSCFSGEGARIGLTGGSGATYYLGYYSFDAEL